MNFFTKARWLSSWVYKHLLNRPFCDQNCLNREIMHKYEEGVKVSCMRQNTFTAYRCAIVPHTVNNRSIQVLVVASGFLNKIAFYKLIYYMHFVAHLKLILWELCFLTALQ